MKIGILGTGAVGEAIGTALAKKHHVIMGSRTAGNEKSTKWVKKAGKSASEGTFNDAATEADLIFICLNGEHALDAIESINKESVTNKILIDLTNPLDFSSGMPPELIRDLSGDTSLGEQIQNALPAAFVVKALNTVNYNLMVDATKVNKGDHNLFLCGNDLDAKNKVKHFLVDNFHWRPESLLDLGGIEAARSIEGIVPFWVLVWQALGTPLFNFKVVK
jgi:predicted dinucleotide-binding enzyme